MDKAAGQDAPPRKTRLAALREQGREPDMPPVTAAYLIDWWREAGLTGAEGPLSWQEIAAWERFHAPLQGWEARAIRRMSEAYAGQEYKSRDPGCPPPFALRAESAADAEARVTKQFEAMVAAVSAINQAWR